MTLWHFNRILASIAQWAVVILLSFSAPFAAAAGLSVAELVDAKRITSAVLSPDGKHIAMIGFTGLNGGVILMNVASKEAKVITTSKKGEKGFYTYDKWPETITWVSNDLIAVNYGFDLESITLEGKLVASLASHLEGVSVIRKVDPSDIDSPMLLLSIGYSDRSVVTVNARTGKQTKFSLPSGSLQDFAFDKRGQLRAVTMLNSALFKDDSKVSHWYKSESNSEWEKLEEFAITDDYWQPLFVPEQPNSLVISSNANRDTQAIFRYDTKKREIAELMAGHPTQDILDVDAIGQDVFRNVVTNGMLLEQYWFDESWQQIQTTVDKILPKRVNILSGNPKKNVLVYSYGDVDPGTWYLLDTVKLTMVDVAKAKDSINPEKMQPMEVISYPAKDGLVIPAYLTKPANFKPMAPMVVLVHGGPAVRDTWRWNEEVQLLADRGYVVFQPQFRGSYGFGKKFLTAGYGQWGLAMQDDISTGVEYLIKQGIADPKRVCIVGASYGGYAALWGLVKTPDLYRCGVSFAGVSDIELLFNINSDATGSKESRQFMRMRIGDTRRDKQVFDQVSPLKQVNKMTAPLLLMHGDEDTRVPIAHSRKMMAALDRGKKDYQWVEFKGEGHSFRLVKSKVKYFETLLNFLEKNIGTAPKNALVGN